MKIIALLLLASLTLLASAGTLTLSCNPCAVGQTVIINGTGFPNGQKTLVVLVIGSPTPVECTVPAKDGSFTCVTTVPLAGTFDIPAFWHDTKTGLHWTEFADTSVQVE